MSAPSLRDQLLAKLDQLTDDEIRELIEHIDMIKYKVVMQTDDLPPDYSEDNDVAIGLFSSDDGELSMKLKQILRDEITPYGWTQKRDDE
jgi:hypothetical protein